MYRETLKIPLYTCKLYIISMKKSFLIKDLGEDLHFQFKKYALFNKVTMEKLGIDAIKDRINYQEPQEEAEE